MRAAATIAEFLADPIGRYVAGRTFVTWVYSPKLAGSSYFGRLELDDHAPILGMFDLYRNPALAPPFRALVDGAGIEVAGSRAYDMLSQFMARWTDVAPRIERVAIVRPPSMAGAVWAGVFHETIRPTATAQLFERRAEAYAWLDVPADAIAAIEAAHGAGPPLLRDLRTYLANDLREASLESAARALKTSPRTLQRTLASHATSFRAELDAMRVATAERLLLDGDLKMEAIAHEIGCKSPSAFYELFRRHAGEPPQAFRDRRRK